MLPSFESSAYFDDKTDGHITKNHPIELLPHVAITAIGLYS